jgi:hypothetical protein
MDMTKFEDVDDPGFVAVTGELRRWIKELATAGRLQGSGPTQVSGVVVPQRNAIGDTIS